MKVYAYTSWHRECPPAPNGSQQTRDIVAARSFAAAARAFGKSPSSLRPWCSETGNAEELSVALSKPGAVFWRPLDFHGEGGWRGAKP